jgi:uncharacterized repeat protein (TIGR01451 family)
MGHVGFAAPRALPCVLLLGAVGARAAEITIQNDSVTNFSTAVIVTGFTSTEKAAAWLTTPCAGNLRAVQILWRSDTGATPPEFGEAIEIFRASPGGFPNPGPLAQAILGPVLNDGVINEYRYLDENMAVPLVVPVVQNETVAVALAFDVAPPLGEGPSVVRDIDGCQAGRNTIFADPGVWVSSCLLGLTGDWVIRAVVDCQAGALSADLAATIATDAPVYSPGQSITFVIGVSNAGPQTASNAQVIDAFPSAIENVTWTCSAGAGAGCGSASGSGNLNTSVSLAPGASASYVALGTIAAGADGNIADSVTVVAPNGVTDPVLGNNIAQAQFQVRPDAILSDGFETP